MSVNTSKWPTSYILSGYLKPENINRPHKDGETLLLRVIWNCFDRISDVLEMGADINLARESDGITPLMALSMNLPYSEKEQEIIDWIKDFIRRGADIHAKTKIIQDKTGKWMPSLTALMIATTHQSAIAFQALIESGANMDEKDSDGNSLTEILNQSFQANGITQAGLMIQSLLDAHCLNQTLPASVKSTYKSSFL